jgi:glycosyltransferase involved in cell wall biosynthesis
MPRVLHLLSQRPGQTGSGITLRELIRLSTQANWQASAAYAVNSEETADSPMQGLDPKREHRLWFQMKDLPFAIPGMSDVMPYESTRWSEMNATQLDAYRQAWSAHLEQVFEAERPDLVHVHHLWLLSALLLRRNPSVPVVLHCHATALRQMQSCPHLCQEALSSLSKLDALCVLHEAQRQLIHSEFRLPLSKIHVVGAGYNESIFHAAKTRCEPGAKLLYAGKFAKSKGLDILLDLVEPLSKRFPDFELHLAGSGSGKEGRMLHERALALSPRVKSHGRLSQAELGQLMQRMHTFVLPSLYEGLPLVLIEALAAGCRLVASDLPGVRELSGQGLRAYLRVVPFASELKSDHLQADEVAPFRAALFENISLSLCEQGERDEEGLARRLDALSWDAVFKRVEKVWTACL